MYYYSRKKRLFQHWYAIIVQDQPMESSVKTYYLIFVLLPILDYVTYLDHNDSRKAFKRMLSSFIFLALLCLGAAVHAKEVETLRESYQRLQIEGYRPLICSLSGVWTYILASLQKPFVYLLLGMTWLCVQMVAIGCLMETNYKKTAWCMYSLISLFVFLLVVNLEVFAVAYLECVIFEMLS